MDITVVPASISPTKIVSIKLYRAKLINRIVGTPIDTTEEPVNIPHDVDDLEASDEVVLSGVDPADPAHKAAENIRESGSINPLNWQRSGDPNYLKNLRTFRRAVKDIYAKEVRKLVGAVQNPNTFANEVTEVDLTPFTTINSIVRDLEFGNRCGLVISLIEARNSPASSSLFAVEKNLMSNLEAVPRENDVVEILAQYPDGRVDRWFLGLVSIVEFTEQNKEITSISVTCHGISKLLQVNKLVIDRSVFSQFEDGAMPQNNISFFGGTFKEKTVDEIFASLMISQMATSPTVNTRSSSQTRLMIEITAASESWSVLENRVRELLRFVSKNTELEIDRSYKDEHDAVFALVTEDDQLGYWPIKAVRDNLDNFVKPSNLLFLNELSANESVEDAKNILLYRLAIVQYDRRVELIRRAGGLLERAMNSEGDRERIQIDFSFDQGIFASEDQFQLIYVPLVTMMAVRARSDAKINQKGVIARFNGRRARAYDLMVRQSNKEYFSQISSPNDVLGEVRSNAKFVVYENEMNQVVCEIPRYNEFGADPGEDIKDFIIVNPSRMTVSREDVNMMARQDMRGYQPIIGGAEPVGRFLMGQFTDPAVLVRYGMRVDTPAYNPNIASITDNSSPFLFAALELVVKNARTRMMTVEVAADRPYRTGRLYFVARESLERMVGGPQSFEKSEPLRIQGYIGYLQNYETKYQHGNPITHTLTFLWVRKARLLPVLNQQNRTVNYVANFRYLPDIGGFMDLLEKFRTEGRLSENAFGDQPIDAPKGTAEILRDSELEDWYYAAKIRLTKWSALLSLDFLSEPTQQQDIRITTSPFQLHHRTLAPANGTVDRLAVIKVDDTGEGLQSDLVNAIAYIDVSLRRLNIAATASPNLNPYCPVSNSSALTAKRTIFRVVYVPNKTINPFYRLVGLNGLTMTLIHPHNENWSIIKEVIQVKAGGTGNIAVPRDLGILQGDFSIAAGSPFRADDATPNFVILQFSPRSVNSQTTFLASANEIKRKTSSISETVRTASGGLISGETVSEVIKSLSNEDADPSQYVVAIFHGPYNKDSSLLSLVDPGIPLSIYDAAHTSVSTFDFPSTIDIGDDADKLGENQQKHAQGNAIDLTIFPWIARTGLRLAPINPSSLRGSSYVLQAKYCGEVEDGGHTHSVLNDPVPKPIMVKVEDFVLLGQISPTSPNANDYKNIYRADNNRFVAEKQWIESPLRDLCDKIRVVRKNSPDEITKAETAFQKMLDDTGISPYMLLTDLAENDCRMWHLEV